MTVTLTKHIGEIYISFEGETAAEVVALYRGYRDVEREVATPVDPLPDDDWIEWGGGVCPVAPTTIIVRKYRDGLIGNARSNMEAGTDGWIHGQHGDASGDIVAYRVVAP